MSNDFTKFSMYSDAEMVNIALTASTSDLERSLALRLGDALDRVSELEHENTSWNPYRRKEATRTEYVHDA